MTQTKTKYDKLLALFDDLVPVLSEVDSPYIATFCSSWKATRRAYEEALAAGIRKSQLASGMEQGLRELPMLFQELDGGQRLRLLDSFYRAVVANYPEFCKDDDSLLASILKRSKIRNEREYYLVRHQIDALEGNIDKLSELQLLYKLVDQFES